MSNRTKPHYLKRVKFSLSLPAWQRALLPHIDAKSNSRAATLLINAAIRSGALHTLAPGLPSHLTDPGALAAYLTNQAAQPQSAAPTQAPAVIPAQAPALQSIWDKPADQLNDADLRELQHHAEASLLLNRPC